MLPTSRRPAERPRQRERASGGLQAVLGAFKSHRRNTGAREATGGPRYYRLLRGAADVVASPRPWERAVGGLQAVLGAVKYRRCCPGAHEATGGPWECGLLRRAADVVAGPGSSATKARTNNSLSNEQVNYDEVVFNVSQNPPLWAAGTLGCKKRAKRQPQREVLTTRLCHQEI